LDRREKHELRVHLIAGAVRVLALRDLALHLGDDSLRLREAIEARQVQELFTGDQMKAAVAPRS
jgi:hypothetical protein